MSVDHPDVDGPSPGTQPDPEAQPADKLDQLAGGRTLSEHAPNVPRGHRGARAAAVQALYEEDISGHPPLVTLRRLEAFTRLASPRQAEAEAIVRLVMSLRADLDQQIARHAPEFPVEQIGAVERNVLRVAMAELRPEIGTPRRVVANEAVEIARLFGSESSSRFVNGVLGALLR